MSKISDFIKKCKLPILWTIGYVFILWSIMHILFNFEIFNWANWIRVSHAHLRGIAGFTFGILTLAAIPLYIATTSIVIRTQKLLLTIPMPKFLTNILKSEQKAEIKEEEKPNSASTIQENTEFENIPAEMRGVFMRAKAHPNRITAPICSACSTTPNIYPNDDTISNIATNNEELPLPPDFDTDTNSDYETMPTPSAPVFHDLDFYNSTQESTNTNESMTNIENPVIKYLQETNRNFSLIEDDIILTDNAAIATHNDPDFWIMDEPTWFAAGKTRESPIVALLSIAKQNKIEAILYLSSTNIMNLDAKRTEWETLGIKIITNLSDL